MHLYRAQFLLVISSLCFLKHVLLHISQNKDVMFWTNTLCASPDINFNIYGIFQTPSDRSKEVLKKLVEQLNQKCSPVILLNIDFLNDTQSEKDSQLETVFFKDIVSESTSRTKTQIRKQKTLRFEKIWQLNIIIIQNEESILKLLKSTTPFKWRGDGYFVIIITNAEETDNARISIAETVLKLFWTRHKILRTLVLYPTSRNVFIYEPFREKNNSDKIQTRIVSVGKDDVLAEILFNLSERRVLNFNSVNMTIRRDLLPRIKMSESDGQPILGNNVDKLQYYHDILMHTIIKHLNFVPQMVGRYQGTDFNVFAATYDFNFEPAPVIFFEDQEMLELTVPVIMQAVCIGVAKGAIIPQSLQLFRCFTREVWLWILMSTIAIIIIFQFLLHPSSVKILNIQRKHLPEANESQDSNQVDDLTTAIINSFLFMTGASVPIPQRLSNMLSARFILSGILLANVTIMGAFASSLYTSFTVAFHYKDIQDAKDLYEAGLWFLHNRNYTMYPFGKDERDPSPYVYFMRERVKSVNKTNEELFDLAILGKIATRVGLSDDESVIFPIYPSAEQQNKLHILRTCTRYHYSSYSTMKESPYYDRFNEIVYALNQAGITRHWMSRVHDHARNVIAKRQNRKDIVSREFPAPFNLSDLQSAFYILTIGLIMATISFIVEQFWFCSKGEMTL